MFKVLREKTLGVPDLHIEGKWKRLQQCRRICGHDNGEGARHKQCYLVQSAQSAAAHAATVPSQPCTHAAATLATAALAAAARAAAALAAAALAATLAAASLAAAGVADSMHLRASPSKSNQPGRLRSVWCRAPFT